MNSLTFLAQSNFLGELGAVLLVVGILFVLGISVLIIRCWRKVTQGTAIVRNGVGGTKVSFTGMFVIPVLHKAELMDISVKRIEIDRAGEDGLVCKDNLRADIKVAFFVRVNKESKDVVSVAQFLGCDRASDQGALNQLFEPKFSDSTPKSRTKLTRTMHSLLPQSYKTLPVQP